MVPAWVILKRGLKNPSLSLTLKMRHVIERECLDFRKTQWLRENLIWYTSVSNMLFYKKGAAVKKASKLFAGESQEESTGKIMVLLTF